MWASEDETRELFGLDMEYEVWKAINYTACDLGDVFQTWAGSESSCEFVQNHIRLVFQTEVAGTEGTEDVSLGDTED